MCRWGCATVDTTYMCKWCGTRYCKECLRGDFPGLMKEATRCRKCNQTKCQGARVDYVPRPKTAADNGKGKSRGKSATRSRSASPSKASSKSGKAKKSGKKSGKKRKRR